MRCLLLATAFLLSAYSLPSQPTGRVATGPDANDADLGSIFALRPSSKGLPRTSQDDVVYLSDITQLQSPGPHLRGSDSILTLRKSVWIGELISVVHTVESGMAVSNESNVQVRVPATIVRHAVAARHSAGHSLYPSARAQPPCVRLYSHPRCRSASAISDNLLSDANGSDKVAPDAPTIVIVIDDFGYRNDAVLDGFMHLDARLTYAVIPGHAYSFSTAAMAIDRGYEVILHMPMEALSPTPGELQYRLTLSMSSEEMRHRLRMAFHSLPQVTGLSNHQGSAATGDERVMRVVGSELRRAGKFFLDSRTSPWSVAEISMKPYGVPTVHRDVFLDHYDDIQSIRRQLNILADMARSEGFAVGIGHVRYNTLTVLRDVIPRLQNAGFEFAFASQVVK